MNSFEGHPDNVAPAILGGVVICCLWCSHAGSLNGTWMWGSDCNGRCDSKCSNYQWREPWVLPASLAYGEAVEASSRSNVLVAGLMMESHFINCWKIYSMKRIVQPCSLDGRGSLRLQSRRPWCMRNLLKRSRATVMTFVHKKLIVLCKHWKYLRNNAERLHDSCEAFT